jgi:hypothetical protein
MTFYQTNGEWKRYLYRRGRPTDHWMYFIRHEIRNLLSVEQGQPVNVDKVCILTGFPHPFDGCLKLFPNILKTETHRISVSFARGEGFTTGEIITMGVWGFRVHPPCTLIPIFNVSRSTGSSRMCHSDHGFTMTVSRGAD